MRRCWTRRLTSAREGPAQRRQDGSTSTILDVEPGISLPRPLRKSDSCDQLPASAFDRRRELSIPPRPATPRWCPRPVVGAP